MSYWNARTGQSIDYHNWTETFRNLPINTMDEAAGRNLDFWKDWVQHPRYDDYWAEFNDEERWGEIAVPAFNMGGWYDLYAPNDAKQLKPALDRCLSEHRRCHQGHGDHADYQDRPH